MFNRKSCLTFIVIVLIFTLILSFNLSLIAANPKESAGKKEVVGGNGGKEIKSVPAESESGKKDESDKEVKTGLQQVKEAYNGHILVGLTEIYLGGNNLNGNLEAISGTDKYQERIDRGRVSFFLKGKIKGKYLLTAWLDTEDQKLEDLFSNLDQRRLDSPFEKINPEKYYPVYGDNSTVSSSVNTAGKLYIALSSEEFKALWGSYKLNFDRNKLIDFNRSFYGFNLNYESDFSVNTYWQQPFSLHSQDELQLTGGMLYYLRHDDLIRGSEDLKLELRDAATGRTEKTINLVSGIDYELNYLQGRVILKKNIDRLTDTVGNDLIQDESGEDKYYLIADYEYDYDYKDNDSNGYGLETSYQLGDNFLVSGTYLHEKQEEGVVYEASGIGLNYTPSPKAELKLDWARSENVLSGKYVSDDGGLNYEEVSLTDNSNASAWSLKYNQKFNENKDVAEEDLSLYYSNRDKGFSSGSQHVEEKTEEYGVELTGKTDEVKRTLSYEREFKGEKNTDIYKLDIEQNYSEKLNLDWELRNKQVTEDEEKFSLTGAAGFDYQLAKNKKIYGSQQLTIDKSSNKESNNLTTLGGELTTGKWSFNLEGTAGDDESLNYGAGYQINEDSEVYTRVTRNFSEDGNTDTETTVGTKSKLNEDVEVYGEHRVEEGSQETEASNVLGADYSPGENWQFGFDYTASKVKSENDDNIERDIIGLNSSYNDKKVRFDHRLEYRKDKGQSQLEQLIMTGDLSWNYNQELTLLLEVEYSREEETAEEEYTEGTIGLAYRPIKVDRLNLIGKYTYLKEDGSTVSEDDGNGNSDNDTEDSEGLPGYPAEKSQVFALDVIYDINPKWQLAEKLAYKSGEVKLNTIDDDWTTSTTSLWINRINYQWKEDVELFTEYRILDNSLAEDRKSGFLLGGYKRFDNNLKLGAGYNFTDFNDDLTDLSYEAEGWFINIIKAW